MCGNGARCVAHYAYTNNISDTKINFINNFGIITSAEVDKDNVKILIKTDVEYLDMSEKRLEIRKYLQSYQDNIKNMMLLKIGVPHLLIILDVDIKEDINVFGKHINSNIMDYDVNINFVNQETNTIRTYERGVNAETYACGTGCCAAMVALNNNEVTFKVKSGEFVTASTINGDIYLEGPVQKVFKVI